MTAETAIDISDYTIDYVRIRLPVNMMAKIRMEAEFNARADEVCSQWRMQNNCYNTRGSYQTRLGRWDFFWNIWGPAAEAFFHQLNADEMKSVTRLDVRTEIDPTNVDFERLFHLASSRNTGKGTVKHYDSPHREKIGGRDAGGKTVQIGGDQSQKKLNIYQRASERPAVEVQLSGDALRKELALALGGELLQGWTVTETVKEHLVLVMHDHYHKKIGYTISETERGIDYANLPITFADEETALIQMEIMFHSLSDNAKAAHIEGITGETGYITAVSYEMSDSTSQDADNAHGDEMD